MRTTADYSARGGHRQRKIGRSDTRIPATLRQPTRQRFPISVINLSARGCGIETKSPPPLGAMAWLRLPGLESWFATIAWSEPGRAGLDFTQPLHPAVVEKLLADNRSESAAGRWTSEMKRRFG